MDLGNGAGGLKFQSALEIVMEGCSDDFSIRRSVFQRFLTIIPESEETKFGNMFSRRKRKKQREAKAGAKKPKEATAEEKQDQGATTSKELVPCVSVPLIPAEPKPWWARYGKILALDVEKVSVPLGEFVTSGNSENFVGFMKSRFNKSKPPYIMEAATVGLVNMRGDVVYNELIKHEPGSFLVNKHTIGVNGLRRSSLKDGKPIEDVRTELEQHMAGSLIIVHDGEGDFTSLGLNYSDYRDQLFDLALYYKRTKYNEKFKLKSLYENYFGNSQQFQAGVHNVVEDAKATMKVFRDGYCMDPKLDKFSKSLAANLYYNDSFELKTREAMVAWSESEDEDDDGFWFG